MILVLYQYLFHFSLAASFFLIVPVGPMTPIPVPFVTSLAFLTKSGVVATYFGF